MEIYRLTSKGDDLAHNIRPPTTPEWDVIRFLSRQTSHSATKETIYENVPNVSSSTLIRLRYKGIITGG